MFLENNMIADPPLYGDTGNFTIITKGINIFRASTLFLWARHCA